MIVLPLAMALSMALYSPPTFTPYHSFFFSSRRRHTRSLCDWSSDVCSSDLQSLARFLELEKMSVIALDADPLRVKQAAAAGDSVMYGDAARKEVLTAAGLARAAAVVVSFADTHAAMTILSHVRDLRPEVPVSV